MICSRKKISSAMHSAKNGSMNTISFFVGSNFQEYEIYQVVSNKRIFISKKDLQNILDCPAKLLDKIHILTLFWNFLLIFLTIPIFKTFWCKGRDPSYPCLSLLLFLSLVIRKMKIGPFHVQNMPVWNFPIMIRYITLLELNIFYFNQPYRFRIPKGKTRLQW